MRKSYLYSALRPSAALLLFCEAGHCCRLCLDSSGFPSPTLDFLGAQFFMAGIPAISLLALFVGLGKLADRTLASLSSGNSTPPGPLRRSPWLWATAFFWFYLFGAWLESSQRWLDFGLFGLPLTWAAVFGPPLLFRHWEKDWSAPRSRASRFGLLVIGVSAVAGWTYLIRSVLPL